MLKALHLKNVGPGPDMDMELGRRLNLITGDNGLGKTFLLDTAWWALTRKWPRDLNPRLTSGYPARPTDLKEPATIKFRVQGKTGLVEYESTYTPREQAWLGRAGRPWNPGLVIYALSDGGFAVWDPKRNYWKTKNGVDIQERLPAYVFSPKDVWDGLEVEANGKAVIACNGLIRDWAGWIREAGRSHKLMSSIVKRLSERESRLDVGPLTRIGLDDARDIPSIKTGYAEAVPILHASAGVRRIVALAYMLLWSWNEHQAAARQLGEEPTHQVVMLIDELESHLHPRWQRSILGSVLHVAKTLHKQATLQLITATHSPLILASAEPTFDEATDAWFDLDLDPTQKRVQLQKRPFVRRGTAGRWLTSPAFDLESEGRSLEAETAIARAKGLLERRQEGKALTRSEVEAATEELAKYLPDVDGFWVRWSAAVDELTAPPRARRSTRAPGPRRAKKAR
ncbi:MAG: AAA family ATPase [Planctomycetota bacterium]|nr:AAA family ATPase [Planctomycetota bacterium]